MSAWRVLGLLLAFIGLFLFVVSLFGFSYNPYVRVVGACIGVILIVGGLEGFSEDRV